MVTTESTETPYRTVVTNGRIRIVADTTKDGRGGAEGLRPHELLEAGLATCLNISARLAADALHTGPLAVRTAVVLDRSVEGRAAFRYRCRVDGPLSPEERAAVERAARACAVSQTLQRAIGVEEDAELSLEAVP